MYTVTKEIYLLWTPPDESRREVSSSSWTLRKSPITIQAAELNSDGMVCDFAEIRDAAETYQPSPRS